MRLKFTLITHRFSSGSDYAVLRGHSCIVLHLKAAHFACGSMVLADRLCAIFPRYARKNRTP
jgi:hypothetical protein